MLINTIQSRGSGDMMGISNVNLTMGIGSFVNLVAAGAVAMAATLKGRDEGLFGSSTNTRPGSFRLRRSTRGISGNSARGSKRLMPSSASLMAAVGDDCLMSATKPSPRNGNRTRRPLREKLGSESLDPEAQPSRHDHVISEPRGSGMRLHRIQSRTRSPTLPPPAWRPACGARLPGGMLRSCHGRRRQGRRPAAERRRWRG